MAQLVTPHQNGVRLEFPQLSQGSRGSGVSAKLVEFQPDTIWRTSADRPSERVFQGRVSCPRLRTTPKLPISLLISTGIDPFQELGGGEGGHGRSAIIRSVASDDAGRAERQCRGCLQSAFKVIHRESDGLHHGLSPRRGDLHELKEVADERTRVRAQEVTQIGDGVPRNGGSARLRFRPLQHGSTVSEESRAAESDVEKDVCVQEHSHREGNPYLALRSAML